MIDARAPTGSRQSTGFRSLCCGVNLGALIACLVGAAPAEAGESSARHGEITSTVSTGASDPAAGEVRNPDDAPGQGTLTEEQVRWRTWGIIGGGIAGVAAYGRRNWWEDGFTGKFRTINEGWFGQNTNDGGADKLGHVYSNYAGTRLLARALEWAGNDGDTALKLAAWATLGTFTVGEILDAHTTKWRFSKEDAIMNVVGVGLGIWMEKNPDLDRLLDFRLLYRPSDDQANPGRFDPGGDYSGQIYLLVAKASGMPVLRDHPVLRYFELAVGYGTRGYGMGAAAPGERSRNVYAGISINLSEVLGQTAFRGATQRSRTQRAVDGFLEFVQVPGTAALTHRRL